MKLNKVKTNGVVLILLLLANLNVIPARAQDLKYPPLSEYMMTRDAEIALARSAAPADISERATISVLTTSQLSSVATSSVARFRKWGTTPEHRSP